MKNKIWERWGSKKLLVIVLTLAGYLTGNVPENVLHDALLAYLGAQALADVAGHFAKSAKDVVGLTAPPAASTSAAVVSDTQDTPTDQPRFD